MRTVNRCGMCGSPLGNGEFRLCCGITLHKNCYKKHYNEEHSKKTKKNFLKGLKRKTHKAEECKMIWDESVQVNIHDADYRSFLKYRANRALKEGRGGEFTHLIKEIEVIQALTTEEMMEISQ